MTTRLPFVLVAALLAPIGVVQAGLTWVAVGERLGASPFSGVVPRNSAEAAALGLSAVMLRYLRGGENPHDVYPVRAEIMSSAILRATTLEAAMWSRQVEMIKLLDREGAIRANGERRALACLAVDLAMEDVVEYLAPAGTVDCRPGDAHARVTARTSGTGARP